MSLASTPMSLTSTDEFVEKWRPALNPVSDYLFVQTRTGNPLTQDSVYQTVARACYEKSGKRTNPHLLRDMIVTHVRETDASEKELEALALYVLPASLLLPRRTLIAPPNSCPYQMLNLVGIWDTASRCNVLVMTAELSTRRSPRRLTFYDHSP